jgi:hypothetical protein
MAREKRLMITEHLSTGLLLAGTLGIAICACNGSSGGNGGTGGSSVTSSGGGPSATGGMAGDGSGGAPVPSGGATSGSTSTGGVGRGGAGGSATGGTDAAARGNGGSTSTGSGGRASGGTTSDSDAAAGGGGSTSTGGGGRASGGTTSGIDGAAGGGGSTSTGSGGASGGTTSGIDGAAGAGGSTSTGGSGGTFTGTCTKSKATGTNASGSGPHDVVVETNSDPGINKGTIFRPADLGGDEKYPIFVWGEGGCSQNGLSNVTAMAEIASHGYFVVADGTPNGTGNITMDRSKLEAMGAPLRAYIDWAIAENEKSCSAYYHSLETTKISSNGFSCGGLMAQGTVMDPRITTWGVTSSGMAGADQSFYDMIHTPVLFVEGGPSDMAYDGGKEGYQNVSKLDVPVMWFSKDLGHGGDLTRAGGGDFTKLNLAWLNWWLKGDETVTGKGLLVGAGCSYCSDSAWEVMSDKVP